MALQTPQLDLAPQYKLILQEIFRGLPPVAEIWAFGSRVKNLAHPGSDLDLVVRLLPGGLTANLYKTLRQKLSESSLPIIVDIHDWTKLPPEFQQEIAAQHVKINLF